MGIFFNPRLNRNDSLTPQEIEAKVAERNQETREMTKKAYETGGVPESSASRAADHSSVSRQTAEGKKARRDANTWYAAKEVESWKSNDYQDDDDD